MPARQGTHTFTVHGGRTLHGAVDVNTSKNAAVALLSASLLNHGKTILRRMPRIEDVHCMVDVLLSMGVQVSWLNANNDLEIVRPETLHIEAIDAAAACKTRSALLLLGPLLHEQNTFTLPRVGGCDLGTRSIQPHLAGLHHFGLDVAVEDIHYRCSVRREGRPKLGKCIILIERSDTATENVLLAAALCSMSTTIVNASPNYMVQDLCFFLRRLGVEISGIGTTTLEVRGQEGFKTDVDFAPSEDPIEAMTFLAVAVVTNSIITVRRAPIEFLEVEIELLRQMGFFLDLSCEYIAWNGHTRLVDITVNQSTPTPSMHQNFTIRSQPFPGLNIDNLPFLALISAILGGRTLVHDWVYDDRAAYLMYLNRLGAHVELLDPHHAYICGPTTWAPGEVIAPPALRPAAVVIIAMLVCPGTSVLKNANVVLRGYERLAERLRSLGAEIWEDAETAASLEIRTGI